jgi:glycine/D-amino acid oxidase-like deaminating enzyme
MAKNLDYIIVGQGIAGTVLAHTLMNKGRSVLVIDDPSLSKASKVAAGLYNPVVFKRLVKSWMADELIPFMDRFYSDTEKLLNKKFYHKKQIVKLFSEPNEREFWIKRSQEDVGRYLNKTISDDFLINSINNQFGAAEVKEAGNLDMALFLDSSRIYFKDTDSFREEVFDHKELLIAEDHVDYRDIRATKIIFCEGYRTTVNPYFNWLPFKLTKGEILTVRLSEEHGIPTEKVINKGVFILPLGNNTYKVGATYEWNDMNEEPTEKGKAELKDKLEKVLKAPFEIISHQAGIRPTVNDRRPMLGLHPQHAALGVFNGMGTKGVMLAPYFAKHFVDFLEDRIALDKEVDIARFQ